MLVSYMASRDSYYALTTLLLLLAQGRRQLSFVQNPSSALKARGGGAISSKGNGLFRSTCKLPLGDTLPWEASLFVTGLST